MIQEEQVEAASGTPKRRLGVLDWIAVCLFVLGGLCVGTGLLKTADAVATVRRILPILLFLAAVLVLAELTAEAGLFDAIATRLAILGGGSFAALFGLCVAFAAVTTISLNLDTTAVLLTPVMLALARSLEVPPLPLAMTTVWLANTASLLLPESNLTNLLAAGRVSLPPAAFAARMGLAQAAVIAVTMAFLWAFYWGRRARGIDRYRPPPPHAAQDRVLLWLAGLACLFFISAIIGGVQLQVASAIAAGVLVAAFAVRKHAALRWRLVPWRLPVFVTGLMLVVQTISVHFLGSVLSAMTGLSGGAIGTFRAAAVGVGLSNVFNNLPAYLAGEVAVPAANHVQLLGLLIGTNVGPVITPWASLATLLWYERCRAHDVRVPLRAFMLAGAGLAVVGTTTAVGVLLAQGSWLG